MKICIECKHHKNEYVQTPQGHGRMILCTQQDCRNFVTGEALPAELARREFCGVEAASFYEPVAEEAVVILEEPK